FHMLFSTDHILISFLQAFSLLLLQIPSSFFFLLLHSSLLLQSSSLRLLLLSSLLLQSSSLLLLLPSSLLLQSSSLLPLLVSLLLLVPSSSFLFLSLSSPVPSLISHKVPYSLLSFLVLFVQLQLHVHKILSFLSFHALQQ